MGFRTHAILFRPALPCPPAALLDQLGVEAQPTAEEPLTRCWHPAHLSVGRLGGCTVVLDHLLFDLLLHREAELEQQMTTTFADHQVLGLHIDDDHPSYGWVLWDRGVRRRARAGSQQEGVTLDEGVLLPPERRWPALLDPHGLRWIDPQGRIYNHARMGVRVARWLSRALLGAPLDAHPDLPHARVQRFVELPSEGEGVAETLRRVR